MFLFIYAVYILMAFGCIFLVHELVKGASNFAEAVAIEFLNEYVGEYPLDVLEQVEINIKYEGYIKKAQCEAQKLVDLDNKKIPVDINYDNIHNLASEAKQKLKQIKPTSIGQAMRISGVNPVDISLLMVYIKKEYFHESK